ncbi:hypothetical protein [Puia dinghuensis]|uniref:Uncharacterized protein n=1 Tax=Puia dinghuensis TaxID=1792502 RepID=A0A8J2UIZ7_9BACT|nr:hypothetical protein [Puia dinghuensis]GGB22923.1 hypothetical protein GCM10011511_53560 [Puia dinghuensis]
MKGLTSIPFARQAAELLIAPKPFSPEIENRQPMFWARVIHFEHRYWSINRLMTGLPITNMLELSSGFSFRGLALSHEQPVYYIDTDLPDLIATKQQFVDAFEASPAVANTPERTGHYEIQPLNALDTAAFNTIVDRLPPGPLLILNEGLLVYLDDAEKVQLCGNILGALQRRGGYWITADIYIQQDLDPALIDTSDQLAQFLQQHKVEEKKFRDFEAAADFFTRMGFIVDEEARPDYTQLSTLPHLMAAAGPDLQKKMRQVPKMQATWRLRAKP